MSVAATSAEPLRLLSIVIPARDEEGCVAQTVEHLHRELKAHAIPHEILVVNDGSTDRTWAILVELQQRLPEVRAMQNDTPHGFGRAIIRGLDAMQGDAAIIYMADASDDARDTLRYWEKLNEGYDCVFGSRFVRGGAAVDYPGLKWILNRAANWCIALVFRIDFTDTTNACKAYRRTVIDGCRPLTSPHFNLTVELPLKAIVRGYSWAVMPITWRNRRTGMAKLKIHEMGSRYFSTCLQIWREKHFGRCDKAKKTNPRV